MLKKESSPESHATNAYASLLSELQNALVWLFAVPCLNKSLVQLTTASKEFQGKFGEMTKTEQAKQLGLQVAEVAKSKGIESVVFDRGGYIYHGRVQALAEGAREGGLKF